jgi:hypothetical protein
MFAMIYSSVEIDHEAVNLWITPRKYNHAARTGTRSRNQGSKMLRRDRELSIPIGTAYAVWTGIGAAGVAILGIVLFEESRDVA